MCVSARISPEPLDLWSWYFACIIYSSYGRFLRKKFLENRKKKIFEIFEIFLKFLKIFWKFFFFCFKSFAEDDFLRMTIFSPLYFDCCRACCPTFAVETKLKTLLFGRLLPTFADEVKISLPSKNLTFWPTFAVCRGGQNCLPNLIFSVIAAVASIK